MDKAQSAPDPAPPEPTDPDRERAERHGRMLARLGDLALGLAEAVQGQAVDAARRPVEEDAAADRTRGLGLVFARLSYEVRQTLALEARLAADSQRTAAERDAAAARDRLFRRRTLVKRILQEAIAAEEAAEAAAHELDVDEEDRREDLLEDLEHRLQDDDLTHDIGELPVGEVVARFCRELDIVPDWSRWLAETWAIAEAGHPLSPYDRPEAPDLPAKPKPDSS